MLESQKEIKLEADNAFPEREAPTYKFKLQNGCLIDLEKFHTDEDLKDFLDFLRNEFYSTEEDKIPVPPVVHYKGMEIQIDNIPLVSYLSYAQTPHKTIGEIVHNVMRNERIMALYRDPDTQEEFSDFVDDSEISDMTPFERRMYESEIAAQEELIQRYGKVNVSRVSAAVPPQAIAPDNTPQSSESNQQSQGPDTASTIPEQA